MIGCVDGLNYNERMSWICCSPGFDANGEGIIRDKITVIINFVVIVRVIFVIIIFVIIMLWFWFSNSRLFHVVTSCNCVPS